MKNFMTNCSLFAVALLAGPALAQDVPASELSLAYSYVNANAPPDHCDCFSMNGASSSYAYNFSSAFAVVADVGVEHSGNVRSSGLDLTLTSFLVGARYSYRNLSKIAVFGEVLAGGVHASGGLAAIATSSNSASTDFAALAGAGVDVTINPHLAVRALELDYFWTTLPNGVNGYQGNLRASVGLVFRF
ncbi:MAG TPA: outer membrane beta-barrel protein [Steroidobacteraceae bacterium]|nr:outer membrane beta-barrel protein [Steroidobacteraceae bacterium]